MYEHTVGDPTGPLATLTGALKELAPELDETFSRTMDEYMADLEKRDEQAGVGSAGSSSKAVGRLQGAKLLVSAAYVYLDLLWMHLKTSGVDPTTHPVHNELQRVHAYFGKLREAEPQARPMHVDSAAATRMVTAAMPRKHTRFDEDPPKKSSKASKPKKSKKDNKPT